LPASSTTPAARRVTLRSIARDVSCERAGDAPDGDEDDDGVDDVAIGAAASFTHAQPSAARLAPPLVVSRESISHFAVQGLPFPT
jgi:hypothetical protein